LRGSIDRVRRGFVPTRLGVAGGALAVVLVWCALVSLSNVAAGIHAAQVSDRAPRPESSVLIVTALDAAQDHAGPLRRLYDWTIRWAQTPYAIWALFLLAFAEASFFPVPPDVLLAAMALGTPPKALGYAAICTLGSAAGGCGGYAIGLFLFDTLGRRILALYGYEDEFERLSRGFARRGFWWIFAAALTPIPYKVFTIAAGVCHKHVTLRTLATASLVGRGLRFFAVGALFRLFGPQVKLFIDRYFNILTVALVVVALLGFAAVRLLTGGKAGTEQRADGVRADRVPKHKACPLPPSNHIER